MLALATFAMGIEKLLNDAEVAAMPLNERRYECPTCSSSEVQLCFPVWVQANNIEDRARWNLDEDASPEGDSEKGWCPRCDETVLVKQVEVSSDDS